VSSTPAYIRIAAELREGILDGTHSPGSRLPTIGALTARHGVSDIVIRNAFALLRSEGLIEGRRGGGTIVLALPPTRRRSPARYGVETAPRPAAATSFTSDQKISWDQYRLDRSYSRVIADEELSALFNVEPGTELLRRHFVFYARGEPRQLSTSYLPWSLVAGTPVADPGREPWPGGTPAQLASLGRPASHIEEAVRARMPTGPEATSLRMPPGAPVVAIVRRMYSGADVLEVCREIVMPADRVVLEYAIDLPGSPEM
jgi:GntR family transcriptional regulator